MSIPDINFRNIRSVDSSQQAGFEELCCQLASLECTPEGSNFVRKGRGGDAGVECYVRHQNNSEVGWQAKFLFRWDASLSSQLDKSIATALDKHPDLVEYIVCLPFDLPDSRSAKRISARQKWNDWCLKWEKRANEQKRNISFSLWGKSELCARLMQDDPAYTGRTLYWFGVESLTEGWFNQQFETTKASLGDRYIPETNVELPIRQDLAAFARHQLLQDAVDGWFIRLSEMGHRTARSIRAVRADGVKTRADALSRAVSTITDQLGADPVSIDQLFLTADWQIAISQCLDNARDDFRWSIDLPVAKSESMGTEPERWARHNISQLIETLQEIDDALMSNRWQMANAKAVLLKGPAGIGKSHLLADFVHYHLEKGGPALMLLGETFVEGEPWPQIRDRLDRPATEQFKQFLGALDAAAQAAGTKAIFCIDALNERNGLDIWPGRLAAFLKSFESFPRVNVILTCRSTYVRYIIPESVNKNILLQVEHFGFGRRNDEAAHVYLEMRGILRPGTPNMLPEFENPLFLKTCCDALISGGQKEFPKGLRGVSAIFRFYSEAVAAALVRRMKLDPHQNIVSQAISGFAQLLSNAGRGYATKSSTIEFFESVFRSRGFKSTSLLTQLEHEGLLTVDLMPNEGATSVEMVRFTFERFSDHAISSRLLDDHLDNKNVRTSFDAGRPLYEYVFGPRSYERAGIVEAMAIQLPERCSVELLDVGSESSYHLHQAFSNSLLWREQSSFTSRTLELVEEVLDQEEIIDILISIGTEPTNPYNANFLHRRLINLKMPERDERWSIHIGARGFEGPINTLVSWAIKNENKYIDDTRAELAATMLAWLLTTSHREVRDKATKALVSILSNRLTLGELLLNRFLEVDDLYVLERLLGACYGAALQGKQDQVIGRLAEFIFDRLFSCGRPPQNLLLRDHALSFLEYASMRGVLPNRIDIETARPPYQSPWPIQQVSDDIIRGYEEINRDERYYNGIVFSTTPMNDFARYVVERLVANWSPAGIESSVVPKLSDSLRAWRNEFAKDASIEQLKALEEFENAALDAHIARYMKKGEDADLQIDFAEEELENSESKFKEIMSSEQWEDFRVRAKRAIRNPWLARSDTNEAATFDVGWALRWICKTAHDLGWTIEKFGYFDTLHPTRDRNNHRVERIGKKYQWLALNNLLARMADNLAFVGDHWGRGGKPPVVFKNARQIGLRDIDPSLLMNRTHFDGWAEWERKWWVPYEPRLRSVEPQERLAWLHSERDIVNNVDLIDLVEPKTNRRWLALEGFSKWTGSGLFDGRKELQRDTWFRLDCFLVHESDIDDTISKLQRRSLLDPSLLPSVGFLSDFYLGEYSWHPDIENDAEYEVTLREDLHSFSLMPTVATYRCERSGYDYSIDKTISFAMPAPWLRKEMKLKLENSQSPIFVDVNGRKIFFDPSTLEPGPSAALIDREIFLQALDRLKLAAIWVIAGEKSAYSARSSSMDFGGRVGHTTILYLQNGKFSSTIHKEWFMPSQNQLKEFLGTTDISPEFFAKFAS